MNAGIADHAMQKAFAAIRPSMTEKEVAGVIRDHFASEGAVAQFSIVRSGGNALSRITRRETARLKKAMRW